MKFSFFKIFFVTNVQTQHGSPDIINVQATYRKGAIQNKSVAYIHFAMVFQRAIVVL